MELLKPLAALIAEHGPFRLLIVDSIIALFRCVRRVLSSLVFCVLPWLVLTCVPCLAMCPVLPSDDALDNDA